MIITFMLLLILPFKLRMHPQEFPAFVQNTNQPAEAGIFFLEQDMELSQYRTFGPHCRSRRQIGGIILTQPAADILAALQSGIKAIFAEAKLFVNSLERRII